MSEAPAKQKKPFLNLPLQFDQEPIPFSTLVEFQEWWKREEEFWSWLIHMEVPSDHRHVNQLRTRFNEINSNIQAGLQRIESIAGDDSDSHTKHVSHIQTWLSKWQAVGVCLTSADERAQYVSSLTENDPLLAVHTLIAFVAPQGIANISEGIRGSVCAALFLRGEPPSSESQLSALKSVRNTWSSFHSEAIAQKDHLLEELHQLKTEAESQISSDSNSLENILTNAKANLESLTRTYDEDLALKAPVTYWKEKENWHRKRFLCYGIAFFVGLAITASALWWEFETLLRPALEIPVTLELQQAEGPPGEMPLWPIVVIVASAAFLFWPLRIVVRMMLSNAHLSIDAAERVVMAQTYLSLLRDDEGMKEGDRRLILDALFRPTSTGIVKDDHAPPSTIDAFSRFFSGRL